MRGQLQEVAADKVEALRDVVHGCVALGQQQALHVDLDCDDLPAAACQLHRVAARAAECVHRQVAGQALCMRATPQRFKGAQAVKV